MPLTSIAWTFLKISSFVKDRFWPTLLFFKQPLGKTICYTSVKHSHLIEPDNDLISDSRASVWSIGDANLRASALPTPAFFLHLSFCLSKPWDSWKQRGRHAWKSCLPTWGDTVAVSSKEQQGDEDCCLMTHSGGQMLLVSPRWIIHDSGPKESLLFSPDNKRGRSGTSFDRWTEVFLRRWCLFIFTQHSVLRFYNPEQLYPLTNMNHTLSYP